MSRCFPFPPPGYEKKPITDDPDLLKKEKRKEKKHKKDKKDKEKQDGKEKREKDRSERKHKEKKDKHRDKKKDKEGKSSTPDEKRVHSQLEGYNGEKVHPNDDENKGRSSFSIDKKQSLQFSNGEYNEQLQKKEESSKEKNSFSDEKKTSIQFHGQNGELVRNKIKTMDTENFKFVQELDRRIRDEEKRTGSHQFVVEGRKNSVNRVEIQKMDGRQAIVDETGFGRNATVQNKLNGKTPLPLDNRIDRRLEQKEKMAEKESDDKRGDKRKNKDRDKRREGKDKDTEKEKKEEKAKEKSVQKRAERDKNKLIRKSDSIAPPNNFSAADPPDNSFRGVGSENLKKRKDMGTNGIISPEYEPRPNKMARHISNISPENGRKLDSLQPPGSTLLDKQMASQGAALNNSFKGVSKGGQRVNGMIDSQSQPVSVSAKPPPVSGFCHIPSKPSPIKSPPVITNHLAARSPTTKPPPPPPPPPPSIPNQSLPPLKQPVSRPKPPPAVVNKATPPPPSAVVDKVTPPPPPPPPPIPKKKPPHPDTKYLNQILSVPKLEQWCGFDDQEWLSRKENPSSKKTRMEDSVQVWSEAKQIESVDVCALPYVIPY